MTENEAIKELEMYINPSPVAKAVAVEALKEIQQYRSIGTVEECREAVEKMKPMKPIFDTGKTWICCVCHSADVTTQDEYGEDNGYLNYCGNCGQKLDWK